MPAHNPLLQLLATAATLTALTNAAALPHLQPRLAGSQQACLQLADSLSLPSTTITNVTYVQAGTELTGLECGLSQTVSVDLCRVELIVATSNASQVSMDAWLPDEFYGRFLGTGNGGLNGCIDYTDLDSGTRLHFASVGTNNGHDGDTGVFFFPHHDEIIKDFAYRSIVTEAEIGKQIVSAYYGDDALGKSYYLGCSTGGRQGFHMVQDFPDLFDGVVAGAPAVDWNHLIGAGGLIGSYLGLANNHSSLLTDADLDLITADVLAQCDGIDGLMNGIIDDPDMCDYRAENLLCNATGPAVGCLTPDKVTAIEKLFTPSFGSQGQILMNRMDPGATGSPRDEFGPGLLSYTLDWFKYVIYNDTSFTGANFTIKDVEFAQKLDPAGISTFNTDISAFRDRGGKLLSYHGTQDQLIPLGNSLRYYNGVARTLNMSTLDSFYRVFRVPGMEHCGLGPGAWAFGQSSVPGAYTANTSSTNILLAMVDWVESGVTPDTIVGTKYEDDIPTLGLVSQRTYCPYPSKSVLKPGALAANQTTLASSWECV